jgi:hypothetical protein
VRAVKVIARCGAVCLTVDGLDLTRKEIRKLLMDVAGIAASLGEEEPEKQPMGFGVVTERAAEPEPENFYSDDEE